MLITDALKMWAAWQRRDRPRLGHPSKAVGFSTGGISCWDDVFEGTESWVCGEVDAAVEDLAQAHPAQAAAIAHRYLYAVYRFPRANYAGTLGEAHDWLVRALIRRGVDVVGIGEVAKNNLQSSIT